MEKGQANCRGKYLLVSLHDVSPFYGQQLERIITELEQRGIRHLNILITPNWEGNYDINRHPSFIQDLNALKFRGAELVLHGYDHGPGFRCKTKKGVETELDRAEKLFKRAFGLAPKGFIPPVWLQSKATYELLKERGYTYTETFTALEYFSGHKYPGLPIVMDSPLSNKYAKYDPLPAVIRALSWLYARTVWNSDGIIRYSIHPREADNGNLAATLELLDGFIKRGWMPVTYSELERRVKKQN